jgi:hypothetical protein
MLVAITRAFDVEAIDRLLFLESCKKDFLVVTGDGLLWFGRLICRRPCLGRPEIKQQLADRHLCCEYQ